ncbi:hypothetical protein MIND_01362900 [Mycena indigotica]|uniref:Macrofage activating glycoprotein n=1 Tax=Mycena indigotica TaxID=2126181 RepID=A0A8H6S227_9AGAR|nr:uncharacterized protein MIND_01362900 [Mycena indigotica]KAF7289885.1 hypothetical protein MIND_01362900 [Mycena indigotica]
MALLSFSSSFVRVALVLSTTLVLQANGQQKTFPDTPLANKRIPFTQIPYQVDTDKDLIRGAQFGVNQCNSTTEGPESKCQTSFINSIDDFCLWAPPEKDSTIGNTEGEAVAWCTKPGRGTRLIPAGALQGVQFMRTPDYVQVVGFIDQKLINIETTDSGGEMDPHGADLRGNPLGGLLYSNAWGSDKNAFTQVIEWHNFMGGNAFCLKACDPSKPNAAKFCEHIFDRIGCAYNAPNAAKTGTFESCAGDNQDFPGIYTSNGQVLTYTQPDEKLGAIQTMPYEPKVPASSNCTPFTSASLYNALQSAPRWRCCFISTHCCAKRKRQVTKRLFGPRGPIQWKRCPTPQRLWHQRSQYSRRQHRSDDSWNLLRCGLLVVMSCLFSPI